METAQAISYSSTTRKFERPFTRLPEPDVFPDYLVRNIARTGHKIPSGPYVSAPECLLNVLELHRQLAACLALDLRHRLARGQVRRHRYEQMRVVPITSTARPSSSLPNMIASCRGTIARDACDSTSVPFSSAIVDASLVLRYADSAGERLSAETALLGSFSLPDLVSLLQSDTNNLAPLIASCGQRNTSIDYFPSKKVRRWQHLSSISTAAVLRRFSPRVPYCSLESARASWVACAGGGVCRRRWRWADCSDPCFKPVRSGSTRCVFSVIVCRYALS